MIGLFEASQTFSSFSFLSFPSSPFSLTGRGEAGDARAGGGAGDRGHVDFEEKEVEEERRKKEEEGEKKEEEKVKNERAPSVFLSLSLSTSLSTSTPFFRSSFLFFLREYFPKLQTPSPTTNHKKIKSKYKSPIPAAAAAAAAPQKAFADREQCTGGKGSAGAHRSPDHGLAPLRLRNTGGVCRGAVLGEDTFKFF